MTANLSSSMNDRSSMNAPIEGESQESLDALQRIVQHVGELLEVDDCSIALLDTEGTTLVTLAALQKQGRKTPYTHFQNNEWLAGWAAEHRQALVIDDVSLDPRFKHLGRAVVGSLVCLPLIDKDNFTGTLTVTSPAAGAFDQRTLRVLAIFAEQAVLAITKVRQAESAQRDANRIKANFLSMITHELRSPLNTINGYLELVLAGTAGELNQQQREFVQRARAGSEHLYALVEDILLVTRADAGQLRLNREAINLPEIIAAAVEELELIALDDDITTKVDIASDFPSISADPVRIQQVLRNLISNALQFTPPGGSVTISARIINEAGHRASTITGQSQRLVEVQVQDTGCGIALEHQQRIFERFYQVPPANPGRSSGQGLGLTIVKMIVELHGGQVRVESVPGRGSTFWFTLPDLLAE